MTIDREQLKQEIKAELMKEILEKLKERERAVQRISPYDLSSIRRASIVKGKR